MKLECSTEKLKEVLVKIVKITNKNLSLPILDSILLIASGKSLKLRATNLSLGVEIEIPAKVEKEGIVIVKGDILSNLFLNINEPRVSLSLNKDNFCVKTIKNNILIKSQSSDDFPTIPIVSGKNFIISAVKFIEGIKSVYYSASISDIKPEISSVYIYPEESDLIFVATDSFRLAEKRIKINGLDDFPGILIPFKNINEIIRLLGDTTEELTVCFSKNQISFSYNGIYLTSRIIDGVFPDYRQIIPKIKNTEIIVLKQDLLNALKLSNIFSDKFNQVTLVANPIKKIFEIEAKNIDVGENKTQLSAVLSGGEIKINLNQKYFIDCFQSIHKDSVTLSLEHYNKPIIIKGVGDKSFVYLIMPMNR